MKRAVKKVVTGSVQYDGAGVKLVRVIGNATVYDFDPFLMLDAFDSRDPEDYIKGFPWHPHRGIETVTYLIQGDIEHGDSIGNSGSILDGGCQWMTAGRGILHQEMPQPADRMLGVQLWLNLPKKNKMTHPQYRDIRGDMVPLIQKKGEEVRVISGVYDGKEGATHGDYVEMTFLDVKLEPGAVWELPVNTEDTVFLYLVEGKAIVGDGESILRENRSALLLTEGEEVLVEAGKEGVRFLIFAGAPLREPIAWGGPIVMNTREELNQAFEEIRNGTFITR
jgi:hypothetical protein